MLPETTGNTADLAIKSNNSEINSSDSTSAGNFTFNETADNENTVKTNTLEIIPAIAKPYAATQLAWEPVAEADVITPEQVAAETSNPSEEHITWAGHQLPSSKVYGGYRDLYRDNEWYPSITTVIPMGFGPKGIMAGLGVSAVDCKPESRTCIQYPSISNKSINNAGEAVFDSYLGFGDPDNYASILITNMSQGVYRASGGAGKKTYFGGNHTGISIARNLWSNAAVKFGAEGLWRENSAQADLPKSAFAVISQRIPLRQKDYNSTTFFKDIYLTIGAGNGIFRPLDQVISAQIRSAKDAGCWYKSCTDDQTRKAYLRGTEWGDFYPIGALALAVTDQAHVIAEWTGRNLNLSLSLQPIKEWGWTITPGVSTLIQNSDYGKSYNISSCPDCDMGGAITTRPILTLRSMINIKF